MSKIIQIILSLLTAITTVFLSGSLFGTGAQYARFDKDVAFQSADVRALTLTDAERARARRWYEDNILYAGANGRAPAYDFSVNGVSLRKTYAEWTFTPGEESAAGALRRGGKTATVTLTHESGLKAEVETTFYEQNATAEWTVYIENTGEADSGVISSFYALSAVLPTGKTQLYCSRGSHDDAGDFTMMRAKNTAFPLFLTCSDGRSTNEFLPYFNLSGTDGGAVLAIGWTGLWSAVFQQKTGGMSARVSQKNLTAALQPGERIRSPLVSLSFFDGKNPVKGFGCFRNWIKDCVYPENAPTVENNMDILFVSSTRTAADIFYDLDRYDKNRLQYIDNFWMDAGWYAGCETNWGDGVGNWTTSEERFPEGIKAIADYGAGYDTGLVLWYEPERLTNRSYLYGVGMAHERWIVNTDPKDEKNDVVMWNLAEDDARAYLADYIGTSLKNNGVSVYRQDFNFSPVKFWKYADKHYYGGRTGIAENRYVTGLYAYLDTLFATVPGLVMDNCASGGQRLDLEMTRRSVPMWRSDYNCDQNRPDLLDATQAHTYGLSFWLPVSGTFINFDSEYGARSSIMPILQVPMGATAENLTAYQTQRQQMLKNFYPLSYGGTDPAGITAMQYGDEEAGSALVYQHEKAGKGSFAVRFSGLDPEGTYTVTDLDAPDAPVTAAGKDLMAGSFTLDLQPDGRKAFVVEYMIVK
ncbi:MAG: alpha-galactosidase [Clostridia bacterium]|nr:alpha-galactosidase [Clostridia bacterium]